MQKPISTFAIGACFLVAACGSSTESNLAPVAYSGKYSDISEAPDLSGYASKAALSAVATSGEYKDLLNTPDLSVYSKTDALSDVALSGAYQDLSGAPELSAVALSGSYGDLAGTPDLSVFATKAGLSLVGVSGDYNDLVNSPDLSVYAPIAGLSAVAFSGNYNSLSGVPDLSVFATKDSLPAYATKDSLASVAISGSYSDLKNLPDLNQYATKSSLSVAAVSGDYEDLINLPDLSVYAPVASLAKVATTGSYADLSGTPDLSPYATTASLADYAKVSSLADYATNASLSNYATNASLANYATTASLSNYATNASLSNYAKSADLATVATSGRYQDLSGLLWTGDSNEIVTHAGVTIDVTNRAAFSIISRDPNALTDQSSSQGGVTYEGTSSWQSFTAGVTGKLSAIAVNRWWSSPETGYTLTIYEGDGTGGSVLYSDSNVTVGSGLQSISLSAGVNLVSGQVYTWRLTNSSSFMLVGYNWTSYSRGRGNWYPIADDQDYEFATYVQPATHSLTVASTGKVGIGTADPKTMLDVQGDFRIRTPRSPASGDPCEAGQMAWDGSYVYVCVSTNHWRRSGLADY